MSDKDKSMKIKVKSRGKHRAMYKNVEFVEKYCNKHGRIREHKMSKKELRNVRASCPHHRYTKNGMLKSTVRDNGDGTVTCCICGARFSIRVASVDEIKKRTKWLMEQVDLLKWCLAGISENCFDQDTMEYLVDFHKQLQMFPKVKKRITKVFQKTKQAKRKKAKRDAYQPSKSGSSYGSWTTR